MICIHSEKWIQNRKKKILNGSAKYTEKRWLKIILKNFEILDQFD